MSGIMVNLRALSAMPLATVASNYGLKTAGVVRLMNEGVAPVPNGYAVFADRYGDVPRSELRAGIEALSCDRKEGGALLVRSSGVADVEMPGQKETDFVAVDGRDPGASLGKVEQALRRVCGSSHGMGALIMPLVSGPARRLEGDLALGLDNVSFVADTHSASNDREMYIALVNGLGTSAVDSDRNSILVTVERESCRITSFVNRTDDAALLFAKGMLPVAKTAEYRQQGIDYFSLVTGTIEHTSFSDEALDLIDEAGIFRDPWLMVEHGVLRLITAADEDRYYGKGLPEGVQLLGFTPFASPAPFIQLIGVLRSLAATADGPIQVEGAFSSRSMSMPHLYQRIDVPHNPVSDMNVPRDGTDGYSEHVIGTCDIRLPLIALETKTILQKGDWMQELDRRFSKTGYALLASKQTSHIIGCTPHCRVRLSLYPENMASHAATYARILQARKAGGAAVLASQVNLSETLEILFNAMSYEDSLLPSWGMAHLLSPEALIRSNGRALSVVLDPPEDSESPPAPQSSGNPFMRWLRSLFLSRG